MSMSGFSTYETTPFEAHERIATARTRCPVAHSDRLGAFHILLRYDDIKSAAVDWKAFSLEADDIQHEFRGSETSGVPSLPAVFEPRRTRCQ